MYSDEDSRGIQESSYMRPGDEIISIREVCLSDKFDKKELGFHSEPLLSNSGKNDLFRDGFFSEVLEPQQARFAWTEEDGNIASLVSEPGFGTTGTIAFGKDMDADFKTDIKDPDDEDISSSEVEKTTRNGLTFTRKPYDPQAVSSTSSETMAALDNPVNSSRVTHKVDKADPRSRFHYVKYVKRHGRSIKLWECGICCREFQHQYTLMRHLPTHTDERNFHCESCGKSFRQLSTLSQHRAIHSSERPYSCEVCRKTFNRVSTLISHRKTHSNEKPYKCHMCPKGFHQKGNLRNHLFTHTNERPYRCNICLKGFNQQSNLVCHKSKVHSDTSACQPVSRSRSAPRTAPPSVSDNQPDSTRPPADFCEVSSSVGPYLPAMEGPSSSWQGPLEYWDQKPADLDATWGSGVIVDAIQTYHMNVAVATKQTPFALLKPHDSSPVLVKVVDTNLPGGKQMLVPATAEDLRDGGKIVMRNDEISLMNQSSSGVQIRVPVVATVVPRIGPGGRLQLVVEEPHQSFHTALSSNVEGGASCSSSQPPSVPVPLVLPPMPPVMPRPHPPPTTRPQSQFNGTALRAAPGISSSCALPPPAPSPPLDLISLDLFEPMECIPLGPQITAVDVNTIGDTPQSDESDFCIGEFQESIPLSDSD